MLIPSDLAKERIDEIRGYCKLLDEERPDYELSEKFERVLDQCARFKDHELKGLAKNHLTVSDVKGSDEDLELRHLNFFVDSVKPKSPDWVESGLSFEEAAREYGTHVVSFALTFHAGPHVRSSLSVFIEKLERPDWAFHS